MSCPPCCYCGAVSLPDATPKDHFPSIKHLTLCVSVTQKHIVHTDTQAHTCSHTVAPHASLNTMKTWPTPPCHLVKNNSFCNRLWLCFNNSRTLISQNSTTLLFLRYHSPELTVMFWLRKVGRHPEDVTSILFLLCCIYTIYNGGRLYSLCQI